VTELRLELVPPLVPVDERAGTRQAVPVQHDGHDPAEAYRTLAPAVLGYLRSQRVLEPEDVLGEVFVQVARDVGRFRGDEADLRRWVFSIAHNRMVDAWRRRQVRPIAADAPVPDEARAEPAFEEVETELVAALAALTRSQREVLVLRFVADLPLQDVARITHRPLTAVKALQRRGLAQLRLAVDRDTNHT
jgi:RNA polymerase sigma-70 factor (ECF subfamily)